MEYIDLYDINRKPLNKKIPRYEAVDGTLGYYQIVNVIIINNKNEILISKRSKKKKNHKLMWECGGGAISSGEESFEAALREMKEELGIKLNAKKGKLLLTIREDDRYRFRDVYVFYQNIDIDDVIFTDEEVCDAKYVTIEEFKKMYDSGEIVQKHIFVIDSYEKIISERIK